MSTHNHAPLRTAALGALTLLGLAFLGPLALLEPLAFLGAQSAQAQYTDAPAHLDCESMDCAGVLPGSVRFEPVADVPYVQGFDSAGESTGWVVMSTELVDIVAYSGKPLTTLIGLDHEGVIAGAQVIHHSEPILLVGIPVSELHDFVAHYVDLPCTTQVVVGTSSAPEAVEIDSISGATVTALAQNQTILETSRTLAVAAGVLSAAQMSGGHFVEEEGQWTWAQMMEAGIFGRLTVSEEQMGFEGSTRTFVDLYYTVADAPQVGRVLIGERAYAHLMEQLEEDEHLVVILGNGTNSFKGSAFVRGGIFDRVRIDQGLTQIVFRDTDYENLSLRLAGAPRFREGAVFITRGGILDPGTPFEMVFLGSRYDNRDAYSREFREFRGSHQLPQALYFVDAPLETEAIWVQAWRNRKLDAIGLGIFLLWVAFVFAGRKWSTGNLKRLQKLHVGTMAVSVLGVGVYLGAQPSVTQILTLVDSLIHEWRWELFATEPMIFMLWIFIFLTSLYWGRGVFCGWICPYGALTELVFKVGRFLKIPEKELPDSIHKWARYFRYFVLLGLIPVFLNSSVLGEQLAEIEPFKSTFLVPAWTREWYFLAWWVLLLVASLFTFRPFCRYICPLGAGLAIFNTFRFSGPKRRSFCTSCTICTKGCEPRAIRKDGTIDAQDCLSCMECEANYREEEVCPPLIGIDRLLLKTAGRDMDEKEDARMKKLIADRADV